MMLTLAVNNLADLEQSVQIAKWIPLLPLIAMVINGVVFAAIKPLRKLSAAVTIAAVAGSFVISFMVYRALGDISQFHHLVGAYKGVTVDCWTWISSGDFTVGFSFFIDPLTCVMLMVVTGIGTLIAVYASGYMSGDPGYYRFFSYIALFIVAMTLLVMGENLLMLFLGWEGVGLSSYLLIGYYYRKPSAVAAAKKAFIVNRIGDFGFSLGLMGVFLVFGTINLTEILPAAQSYVNDHAVATASVDSGHQAESKHEVSSPENSHTNTENAEIPAIQLTGDVADARHNLDASNGADSKAWLVILIPFLLMLGAFGKSAQLPLHVWLPDAMEGPTPVSALIHAATMVTAGVYMIARLLPIFQLSEYALPTVAVVGGLTAFFAATIALCQYDIKRVWAYSTVSQLGYMFVGVGVLASTGAVFHLFTHAFFKALLFLTAGSVMHALAGQLDMRKFSGLFKLMPVTALLMLVGCLALAGVPPFAGFYSKDEILAHAFVKMPWVGVLGIITALLTAFYAFRLWFRVFLGETKYEMGKEHHGYEVDHPLDDHHHGPHEMSWLMNGPLVVLALGAIFAGWYLGPHTGWMAKMIGSSTAVYHDGATVENAVHDAHFMISIVSGGGAILMIALAALFHWKRRDLTEKIAAATAPVVKLLNNKYYIDELYHCLIVMPLRGVGHFCYQVVDRVLIDGVILGGISWLPRLFGLTQQSGQTGRLQGYAVTMGLGLVVILAIVVFAALL